jgi:uncharacterized cupin superfamily protein
MAVVDRARGVNARLAIKAPCRVATTANITLSGEQTIDGVAVVAATSSTAADRVLVKDQDDASENGIWEVGTGAWTRAPDWDGIGDVMTGTFLFVHSGSTNSGGWRVTTTGVIDVGETEVTFTGPLGTIAVEIPVTAFIQTLLDDTTQAAARTTLGVGTGNSPEFAALNVGHASDTTVARASAGNLSVAGTLLKKVGRETLTIPAACWAPTITNGAGRSYTELATNDLMSETIDFDTTTQEFATFEWIPPQKWNAGTITFRVRWRAASGTPAQTVDMALSGVAISNDDAEDAAPGTPVVVSDALISTGDHHISPESTAVTIAGTPAKADKIFLRLQRNVSTDNLSADAMVEAVDIFWTSDAATDS